MNYDYKIFDVINRNLQYFTDEESKMLYMQRALYSLSGNIKYIYDIMKYSRYFKMEKVYDNYLDFQKRYRVFPIPDMLSFLWLNRNKDKKIVVFGCGRIGNETAMILENAGVKIDFFCDSVKSGSEFFGKPVLDFETLKKYREESLVIIASIDFKEEMFQMLKTADFDMGSVFFPGTNALMGINGTSYFDDEILKADEEEIFVDAGCYSAETTLDFIEWCPSYKKVYAFEPDPVNAERSRKVIEEIGTDKIKLYEAGLWSSCRDFMFERRGDEGSGSSIGENGDYKVNVVRLDDALEGEKVTFIKMDIEGAELEALKGAKDTIGKYRPKLAICIYHKLEDIFTIPDYIKSIVPEYKMAIRHYTTYLYDTVLYCWI